MSLFFANIFYYGIIQTVIMVLFQESLSSFLQMAVILPLPPQNSISQIAIQDQRLFEGWQHDE